MYVNVLHHSFTHLYKHTLELKGRNKSFTVISTAFISTKTQNLARLQGVKYWEESIQINTFMLLYYYLDSWGSELNTKY